MTLTQTTQFETTEQLYTTAASVVVLLNGLSAADAKRALSLSEKFISDMGKINTNEEEVKTYFSENKILAI